MKIKKIITLLFVLFLSTTISYCSQGQSKQNPLFFEVVRMDFERGFDELEKSQSRFVTLFLKREKEGLVLCLHDHSKSEEESYFPLLLPTAFKLCSAIENNQSLTVPKEYITLNINTKNKSHPILCDILMSENEDVSTDFLGWVLPLSAGIHLSDSFARSNSINTEPEPETTCINFNQDIDLSQILFPKSLEGMLVEDVLKIGSYKPNKTILRLNEEFSKLQEEVVREKQAHYDLQKEVLRQKEAYYKGLKGHRNRLVLLICMGIGAFIVNMLLKK